jgi:hypothetical protein
MRIFSGIFSVAALLMGAGAALADSDCQKCTHDMQVKFRECVKKGRDQDTCTKEEQAAAQTCVAICQGRKAPDEK